MSVDTPNDHDFFTDEAAVATSNIDISAEEAAHNETPATPTVYAQSTVPTLDPSSTVPSSSTVSAAKTPSIPTHSISVASGVQFCSLDPETLTIAPPTTESKA